MAKENVEKNESTSESRLMEQPLMSTGTKEAGFNWAAEKNNDVKKPAIGNTMVGEEIN